MRTRHRLVSALSLGVLLQLACAAPARSAAEPPDLAPAVPAAESPAASSGAEPAFHLLRTTHLAASKLDAISVSKIAADGEGGLVAIGRRSRSRDAADLVIARLDPAGQQRWMRSFPGSEIIAGDLFVADGRIVVVGTLRAGSVDLAGNVLEGRGQLDGFVAVVSLVDGTPIWAKTIGGRKAAAACSAVAPGDNGSFYITGYLAGTVDLGDGPTTCNGQCAYLVKWSADGMHAWTRLLVAPKYANSGDVATSHLGEVWIVGNFKNELVADDQRFVGAGGSDIFLARYSPEGDLRWLRAMGGVDSELPYAVAAGAAGDVAVVGLLSSKASAELGGRSVGPGGGFVAKYDPSGVHAWSRQLASPEQLFVLDTAIAPSGAVLVGGRFNVVVEPGAGMLRGHADPFGPPAAFIAAYDARGQPLAAAVVGTTSTREVTAIAVGVDELYVATGEAEPPLNAITTLALGRLRRSKGE